MYRLVYTTTKQNDTDPWITPFTSSFFTQEELDTIVADYINLTSNIEGVSNRQVTTEGNTMTTTMDIDSLEAFNRLESVVGSHAFVRLRNAKMREFNIENYTVVKQIIQI